MLETAGALLAIVATMLLRAWLGRSLGRSHPF